MRVYLSALIGLLCSPIAQAEISNQDQQLETIVVTLTRDKQPMSESNRAVSKLTEEALLLENHVHIQQALNQLPGVYFHRNSGQEYLAAIRSPVLTGAGACGEFLILENGIPVRPAGMCNVNELFESHHQMAENIEVLRGPATSVYGANGLHGVVNIITPRTMEGLGETQLTIGSNDYLKLNQTLQVGNWTSSLTLIDDGGFRESAGAEQQMFSVKHIRETDDYQVSSYATLFNLDQETAGYLIGEGSYKDNDLIKTNPNPEAYRQGSGFRLYQNYVWNSGLTVSPYFRHSKMEFMQHFLPGQAIEENGQTSLGVQSSKRFTINDAISINLGADAELSKLELLEYQDNPTQGSAFLQATIPSGKHYDYQVDSLTAAAFAVAQWQVSENLMLDAGMRAQHIEFDYDNLMLAGRTDEAGNECGFGGCRFSRTEDRKDDYFQLSPQLGVTYFINKTSQFYASVIHGFRAPQATELYRLQREQTVADLDPVELKGIDLGWRYQSEQLTLEVGLFDYDKSNSILRNTDFFNISGGKSEHQGLELSAKYQLSDNYELILNSTFSKHQYANNPGLSDENVVGLDMDTAPRELSNLFLNYQDNNLSWQLHGEYVSNYFTDVENQHSYPGHLLFHLKGQYQLTPSIVIGARVNNLLDDSYAKRADYSGFSGDRYFPGEPRSFNLSVRYKY